MRQGARQTEIFQHPIVERTVVDKLKGADAVRDALEVITEAVGVVVERVNAPLVAGVVVSGMADAVEQRVAQPHVGRAHVDLAAERAGAVGELAGLHAGEKIKVLCHAAVAEGRVPAGLVGSTPIFLGLLRVQIADVGLAALDELDGIYVKLLEVAGGGEGLGLNFQFLILDFRLVDRSQVIVRFAIDRLESGRRALGLEAEALIGPAGDKPLDVGGDSLDVFDFLLDRVGVVKAQVALAAMLAGDAEVQADGLGVADMQVAVGLGREAGNDLRVALRRDIGRNNIADKVTGNGRGMVGGHSQQRRGINLR